MRIATAHLKSISPYSQSRNHDMPHLDKERPDDYDERTWREHAHVDAKGFAFIPPMAFKNAISECAKYLGMQIPGKGKSTFTKHFEAGVLVTEGLTLPVKKEQLVAERLYLNADGRRGSGRRVWRKFPVIQSWEGNVQFYILDDTITPEVFERHLKEAGSFIGIGRFRPRNNGFYGRFSVEKITWSNGK
jgi:hypothetical protein